MIRFRNTVRSTGWRRKTERAAGRVAPIAVLFALVAALYLGGALNPIDNAISAIRDRILPSSPSHTLTVVEIDSASLRAAGQWPWSRSRFAVAIDHLRAAGARIIGFDVDFSARSSTEDDEALARSISAHAGVVVLPTFVQGVSTLNRGNGTIVESSPLGSLSANALLASINVVGDDDGRMRAYRYGFQSGDTYRQTMAALLAGAPYGSSDKFLIDYGIRVHEIDHLSFEDIYRGNFDAGLVRGRAILVGATALELGDEFVTPRYAILPGVYVHALAYESIALNRALHRVNPFAMLLVVLGLILWLRPTARNGLLKSRLYRQTAALFFCLGLSILVQAFAPIRLDVAPLIAAQLICLLWLVQYELKQRANAIVHEREASLLHQTLHDSETKLPNRRALLNEANARIEKNPNAPFAVVAVGVDRFSILRGSIGYGRSTDLIQKVAARLSERKEISMVARLSSSIVGITLDVTNVHEVTEWCTKASALLGESFDIEGHAIDALARFGIAFRLPNGDTGERLMEQALIALDQTRQAKRPLALFDPETYANPTRNLALMSEMLGGIAKRQFHVHYQPKVETTTRNIVSAEALVRWQHPARGFISPVEFIETAEETGNIRVLTEWVLKQVIADSDVLRAAGADLTLAVNISARLLTDRGFCDLAIDLAANSSAHLCFEITETAMMENPLEAMATIADFRAVGIKISIDDYGTGLSSVSYLKQIHADEVKLDKSLISGLEDNVRDRLIVKSTIDLAHSLDMAVVAEGIEDEITFSLLAAMRCDMAQGYLISKAVPLPEFIRMLAPPEQTTARATA